MAEPFDPKEFFLLADVLFRGAVTLSEEARDRTCIGRAYYAVHLTAVVAVRRKFPSWSPKRVGDDHSGVIQELKRGKTTGLANKMLEMLKMRRHADYHMCVSDGAPECPYCNRIGGKLVVRDDVERAFDLARFCMERLQTL